MIVNPLARSLPTAVRIHGRRWPIRWRVSDCLPVILAYEDECLTAMEQQEILFRRLYPRLPDDLAAAAQAAVEFLDGGPEPPKQEDSAELEDESDQLVLYSFSRDGGMIYSAFRVRYGIDLVRDELHWWSFLALLGDLGPDCRFYQLLRLRRGWLEGTLDKEEARAFERMGPDAMPPPQPGDREAEEHARAFLAALNEGGGLDGIR